MLGNVTIKFIRNALRVFGVQFSGCKSAAGETAKEQSVRFFVDYL
jgi:hypothetical protein